MSKLSKAISEAYTGEVRAAKNNLKYVEVNSSITDVKATVDRHYVFDIVAKFGARGIISDSIKGSHSEVVKNVRRTVVEEVFGEFRPLINDLRIAMYRQDDHQAKAILDKLEYQMFQEDL